MRNATPPIESLRAAARETQEYRETTNPRAVVMVAPEYVVQLCDAYDAQSKKAKTCHICEAPMAYSAWCPSCDADAPPEGTEETGGKCTLAGPGRGDCEHAVGLPGLDQDVDHDGLRTEDVYGKPNGWCWLCWRSEKLRQAEREVVEMGNLALALFDEVYAVEGHGIKWAHAVMPDGWEAQLDAIRERHK